MATNAGYIAKVERDWVIPQGADTTNPFRYGTKASGSDPVVYPALATDGWSAKAQIRSAVGGDIWVTFDSTDLSGPRIELDDDGYVRVILPHDTTEAESWNAYNFGYYDVELTTDTGAKIRLARGTVTVDHDVTREV